jgi:Helix-turn-helix domain
MPLSARRKPTCTDAGSNGHGHVPDPGQVAERYQVSIETLKDWRYHSTGPKHVKVGHHVRYRVRDLERWERTREVARGAASA